MPNRIIKESICTSEKISALTDFEFRLWVGLITQVDDAGRGDARAAIIKGSVFPLRERVTVKDIDAALHSLAAKGCVSLYTVDGKPYFWFPSWGSHQRIRDCKPKYPDPECANDNLQQIAADCGRLRPESNPIQSESNPNPNTNPNTMRASRAENHSTQTIKSISDRYASEGPVREALDGFVEMRKKKGTFTVRALELTLKKLDALSAPYGDRADEARAAILDQSVQRDWSGVFGLKEPLPEKAAPIHREEAPKPLTAEEAQNFSLEELLG